MSTVPFYYPVGFIVIIWALLLLVYLICRWRQTGKAIYTIPRVFVLCSPRTVQFHYELILRIGLPSYDFNPDRHDIDLTVQGQQKNEVVPMTRLNTKTLVDETLITSLSIIVYRLVEMPPLGSLVLKHSGPFKSWVYAYDFTVIDLSTNKEQYYTLNQYIGSLNRVMQLKEPNLNDSVHYPIDDVPLPNWSLEDMFLFIYTVVNFILLTITIAPINCTYLDDLLSILLAACVGGCIIIFLEWLLYYHLKWDQDRRDYFNEYASSLHCIGETPTRIIIALMATGVGGAAIYFALYLDDWRDILVWLLAITNTITLVIGTWNVGRLLDLGESVVAFGLRMRGIDMVSVGMRYSDMVEDMHTKSGSTSSGSLTGSLVNSQVGRPSVKSFGFKFSLSHPSRAATRPRYPMVSGGSSILSTRTSSDLAPQNSALLSGPNNKPSLVNQNSRGHT